MQFSRYESISAKFSDHFDVLFLESHRGFLKMKRKSKNQLKYSISLYIKIISNCRLIVIFLRPLLWIAKTKQKSKKQQKNRFSHCEGVRELTNIQTHSSNYSTFIT